MKEKRMEDAEYIADIDKQAAQVFDLWEYNSYGAQFQLYVATKKSEGGKDTFADAEITYEKMGY